MTLGADAPASEWALAPADLDVYLAALNVVGFSVRQTNALAAINDAWSRFRV